MIAGFARAGYSHIEKAPAATSRDATPNTARRRSSPGSRLYPSGSKVYIVQTRSDGRSRRFTLGRHGVLTADEAQHLAAHTIARVKQGEDPDLAPSGWAVDPARAPHRIRVETIAGPALSTVDADEADRRLAARTRGGAPETLLISEEELAARTGLRPRQSVHDWRRKGRIVGRQNARRGYVIPAGQLEERNRPLVGLDRVVGLTSRRGRREPLDNGDGRLIS